MRYSGRLNRYLQSVSAAAHSCRALLQSRAASPAGLTGLSSTLTKTSPAAGGITGTFLRDTKSRMS